VLREQCAPRRGRVVGHVFKAPPQADGFHDSPSFKIFETKLTVHSTSKISGE
jgi:hypothetical protein